MKVICKPKQSGKTTMVVKRAAEIDGQIICSKVDEINGIERIAKDLNLSIRKPISARQVSINLGELTKNNTPLLIDDAEYLIQYLLNEGLPNSKVNIDTISLTDYDYQTQL